MTETSTEHEDTAGRSEVPSPPTVEAPGGAATDVLDAQETTGSNGGSAREAGARVVDQAPVDVAEADPADRPDADADDADGSDDADANADADASDTDDIVDTDDRDAAPADTDEAPVTGEALLVQEGEIAGDYLEQLLDILDYDGDIDLDVEGSRAIVAIVGANDLDPLVGARGVTLDALQELTRLTVAQQTGVRTRLMLDIGGYRAGRRTELSQLAASNVARVIESGETVRMSPMNAFERKIVHDVVTATDGVRSESEGEDPDRRVVILPDR